MLYILQYIKAKGSLLFPYDAEITNKQIQQIQSTEGGTLKSSENKQQNIKGVIKPDVTYTLKEFMAITGKGRHAVRECKKRGLRILKDGRTPYVYGQDYTDYLLTMNNRLNPK